MWAAEIIKAIAALAWPIAFVVLAIAYKPELLKYVPAFIRRALKLELPGGFKVEVGAAEEQQKAADLAKADPTSGTIELKEIPGLVRTTAIARLERELHARLRDVTADPVDVLVRNLAQARLEAAFGFLYAGIFGSQISGLAHLEARRRVSNEDAYRFYLQYEQLYPEIYKGYGFPGWLGFLRNYGLIAQTGDEVEITDTGDDFLKWLRATRLSTNKPW